jgi:hypothetical protein
MIKEYRGISVGYDCSDMCFISGHNNAEVSHDCSLIGAFDWHARQRMCSTVPTVAQWQRAGRVGTPHMSHVPSGARTTFGLCANGRTATSALV